MAIPNGYRLLTSADVGKTFGVDLESMVYFDTKVSLTGNESYFAPDVETTLISGFLYTYGGSSANIVLNNYGMNELVWEVSSGWVVSNIDMGTDINTVGEFIEHIPEGWNTWLYVRDIEEEDIEEKVIITKSKLTTLADNLREIQGTSEKLTPQELIDGYKVLKSEEALYTNLNEMTFGAGYTVTLQLGTCGSRNPFELGFGFTYSIDGGVTKIPLSGQTVPIVLNNVQTIGFYDTSAATLFLGTSISGSELGYVHGGNGVFETIINVENDMTIYLSVSATNSGGGSD